MQGLLRRLLVLQAGAFPLARFQFLKRLSAYFLLVLVAGLLGGVFGLTRDQVASVTVLTAIIAGALLFWRFRLAFALMGVMLLLAGGLITVHGIIEFASLDVILFLIGMMVLIGFLEERHFFEHIVNAITEFVGAHPFRLAAVLMVLSALFAALVDEVTSILFMMATVFQLSARYRVSPVPLLLMVVFATNIGSSATVVGNPIGVMIALRGGLSFADFLRWATPIAIAALAVSVPILLWYFRRPLAEMGRAMHSVNTATTGKPSLTRTLFAREMLLPWALFGGTILALILHTPIEKLLGLEKNSMLLGTALGAAGLVLLLERERARELVEKRVEWWTLSFFIFLFASVATLKLTGVTGVLAGRLVQFSDGNATTLFFSVTLVSGITSAFMDNVLAIATFIPIVHELGRAGMDVFPLWWGMLFGGCFFGNLTMIGSTANIVAIGMLERRGLGHIYMGEWMKAMALPSILTLALASGLVYLQLLR